MSSKLEEYEGAEFKLTLKGDSVESEPTKCILVEVLDEGLWFQGNYDQFFVPWESISFMNFVEEEDDT